MNVFMDFQLHNDRHKKKELITGSFEGLQLKLQPFFYNLKYKSGCVCKKSKNRDSINYLVCYIGLLKVTFTGRFQAPFFIAFI